MKDFLSFLTEAATEEKLTHLEHAEDHHINAGHEGFKHAVHTLVNTHLALQGKPALATLSTKYDGSPSVVFGYHPKTKKFFVASKSAFNKNPKLNYTEEDIEKNHGHAPGLVSKLKHALQHLPKVTPKGIYQGDFMYAKDDNDVSVNKKALSFKPNTITYSLKKGSEEHAKAAKAKIGVVVHTAYKGKNLNDLKAQYNADTSHFNPHPDVHVISPKFDAEGSKYSKEDMESFDKHMHQAHMLHNNIKDYSHMDSHIEHMKTYINSTVMQGTKPTVDGYKSYLHDRGQKEMQKYKTDKGREAKIVETNNRLRHVDTHADAFHHTLEVHHHLQKAKDVLVHALSKSTYEYEHSIDGKPVKPEGHVVAINNRPTKLVDRAEFSRANLLSKPR